MANEQFLCVMVANGEYVALRSLDRAVPDAQALAEVLEEKHEYRAVVVANPTLEQWHDTGYDSLGPGALADGTLILGWIGHGQLGADGSLRLMGRSGKHDVELANASQLAEWGSRTGARQVLLVIDACHSGGGVVEAAQLADAVDRDRIAPGTSWFGVLSASLSDQKALSGALVPALARLLKEGPAKPDFAWEPHRPFVRGDILLQTLLAEWSDPRQQPYQVSLGKAWDLVRNPRFEAGLPDQPVEHLLQAARGSSTGSIYFSGREAALSRIVAWLAKAEPGLFVLTGSPGCGKSAIAGRIASLSSGRERARILAAKAVPPELDPGPDSVDAQVHARGLTLERVAETLAGQLNLKSGADHLAVLAEASRRRRDGRPLVVIVDGLDEARTASREIATELLALLARHAMVLVATRNVVRADGNLILDLGPAAHFLDLDQEPEATREALRRYIQLRLAGVAPQMDPEKVAAEMDGADVTTTAPFLLARLVTSQLCEQPVDTSSQGWQCSLATSVESALERDLHSVALQVDGRPHLPAARDLARALAFAHGGGLPADDLWPAVATALSQSGAAYSQEQAFALLEALGRHFIASLEKSQPVYRLAHQRLVDYLKDEDSSTSSSGVFGTIAGVMFHEYQRLLDAGIPPKAHTYLWRYAWRHFAEAGAEGIDLLRRLVGRDREALLPDLALALQWQALSGLSQGEVLESIPVAEEAAGLWRELDNRKQLITVLYFLVSMYVGTGGHDKASAAANEAAVLARQATETREDRNLLGSALLARATVSIQEGNLSAAAMLADDAVALCRPDPGETLEDEGNALASACSQAALIAVSANDLEAAARFGQEALEILNQSSGSAPLSATRVSVLSTLAGAELLRGNRDSQADGGPTPIPMPTANRLLEEYRKNGPLGNIADILIAKGIMCRVKGWQFDASRGLPVPAKEEVLEIVEDAIRLVRPMSDDVFDAAMVISDMLDTRARLSFAEQPERSRQDWDEAEQRLRRFSSGSPPVAAQLGEMIAQRLPLILAAAGQGLDLPGLIARQREAIALMSGWSAPVIGSSLASAHYNLALLLKISGAGPDQLVPCRRDAIRATREFTASAPSLRVNLLRLLIDQSAAMLEINVADAADLAREAVQMADALPPAAASLLGGLARMNLASAVQSAGDHDAARELTREAIRRLDTPDPDPSLVAFQAIAHANLALFELDSAPPEDVLRLAQRASDLAATLPASSLAVYVTRPHSIPFALGLAQRRCGQAESGNHILRGVLGGLRRDMEEGRFTPKDLAALLNHADAADLWDEVLDSFDDQPELLRRLRFMRLRSKEQIPEAVEFFLSELHTAAGSDLRTIHQCVRLQRAKSPSEFDAAWRARARDLPPWLLIGLSHEIRVVAWYNTGSWSQSKEYLQAHPELLDTMTDLVLDEVGLEVGDNDHLLGVHRNLIGEARESGVEQAYASLAARIEVDRWLNSEDRDAYFAAHEELLRPEVAVRLRELNAEADPGVAAFIDAFDAALELAQRGERLLALLALQNTDQLVPQLKQTLQSKDVSRLAALATIIRNGAEDPGNQRLGCAMLAIARVLQNQTGLGRSLIASASEESTAEERQEFAASIGQAISLFPHAAADLAQLLSPG